MSFRKNAQYYKFCAYGFLKNLRFYEPFLMLFFLEKGLTYAEIGTLYAVREVGINLMEIPSGLLADTLGRRLTMIVSFVAYIVSFIIFFGAESYWVLLAAMVFYSFGDAFRTGTHKAMIFDYLRMQGWDHLRTHYYGHTRSWSQRGAAVSALIAAALVFWHRSYAPVFLFTIIPYVIDLLLIASYPKDLDGPRHTSLRSTAEEFRAVWEAVRATFQRPAVLRAIANQALYSGYYKACKDYLQPILKSLALTMPLLVALEAQERTAVLAGTVYAALYLLTAGAARASGRLADRFATLAMPLNLTIVVGLAFGLLSGVFYSGERLLPAIVLYIGVYVVENLRKPMGIAYVSERIEQASLATGLSVESQAETIFAALIALAIGFLSTLIGLGLALVWVSAGCGVLALLLRLPKYD